MLYKIVITSLFFVSLSGVENVYLKTPIFSENEIIGSAVGIRPYRKSGVRIESEFIQDKLIIHNYGYGGSGLTLSFGGSAKVLEILEDQNIPKKPVAVLGAGVIGLTLTYDLLKKGYEVNLYSDEWSPNLTSNIGAGIWTPLTFPSYLSEEKKKFHAQLLDISEKRFFLSISHLPEFAGIKKICCYSLNCDRNLGEEVIIHFDNGLIKKGFRSFKIGIDGKIFMKDLYNKVITNGANIFKKHFKSIEDVLNLSECTILNCMRMGSIEIFKDDEFIPVRGHLVYLKSQEGIDYQLSKGVLNSDYFISVITIDHLVKDLYFHRGNFHKIPEIRISLTESKNIFKNYALKYCRESQEVKALLLGVRKFLSKYDNEFIHL